MALAKFRKVPGGEGSGRFVVSEGVQPSCGMPYIPEAEDLPTDEENNQMVKPGIGLERRLERRGQVVLTTQVLEAFLQMPDDVSIVGARYQPDRDLITLYLKGEGLEEVPEGQESPVYDFIGEPNSEGYTDIKLARKTLLN